MINQQEGVIQKALGNDWEKVPEIIRQHFNLGSGGENKATLEGVMEEIHHSLLAKLFMLPARVFGALVPYKGKYVPVTVRTSTKQNEDNIMYWHRTFSFPEYGQYVFSSRMSHVKDNVIVENVKYGMGIELALHVEENILNFVTTCYQWNLGPFKAKLPCWLLLGKGVITERQIDNDSFQIDFKIRHPVFGETFRYIGIFRNVNT